MSGETGIRGQKSEIRRQLKAGSKRKAQSKCMGHRAWRKDRRGEWFSRLRRRFNFENREFLIISILAP